MWYSLVSSWRFRGISGQHIIGSTQSANERLEQWLSQHVLIKAKCSSGSRKCRCWFNSFSWTVFVIPHMVPSRFIAVSIPFHYNRKHVDQRQIVLLSATWILALAVASPVMFGINNIPNRDHSECKLEDNNYVVYSSVCSFFVPCPIMLLLYCGMFRGLRNWEAARKAKLRSSMQASKKLQEATASLQPLSGLPPPLPPVIEKDLTGITLEELDQDPFSDPDRPDPVSMLAYPAGSNNQNQNRKRKRAKINGRERKAMKVLPVVVGKLIHTFIY